MATYMMESNTLTPNFLVEAINCASYIQNRVPHKKLDGVTPFEAWIGYKPDASHFRIFASRAWARIPLDKRRVLEPQIQEFLFVRYSKYSKGYKLINMSTQKYFIQRSVQFKEEPMVVAGIGESSSPTPPLVVSEGTNEIYDYYMYNNDYLFSYPNIPTRPKWEAKIIHAASELARNPRDPRRTRSQFESAISVKDPCFSYKCFIMVESYPHTY